MKQIEELRELFTEINKLKSKAKMNTCQFCSELTSSDSNEFLELHFDFLKQKKRYFQSDLKMYFGFRQDRLKIHTFLKNKLPKITDKKLKEDIQEIIEDINYKTLDELQDWVNDLKSGTKNNENEFVWSIMKSSHIEYHYNLMKDKTLDDNFRRSLRGRFKEHKQNGAVFLLNKLDNNEDIDFQGEIIFLLGKLGKYNKDKILQYARKLTESNDNYTRDRAIIVLGWVGEVKEFPILKDRLLNDLNVNCRAWSASSFMQMWIKRKSEKLRQFALSSFKESLEKESDYFVLSTIIGSIREIENNKFGISQKSLNDLNKEEIDKAKNRVNRYIDKNVC